VQRGNRPPLPYGPDDTIKRDTQPQNGNQRNQAKGKAADAFR
jgi:hypothetical protein